LEAKHKQNTMNKKKEKGAKYESGLNVIKEATCVEGKFVV